MPIEIPDLWSDDIQVDVLPPLVILKAQSEPISRKTKGILRTEVTTVVAHQDTPEATTTHVLDLVAPALNYSESLLEVCHKQDRMYPATLTVPDPIRWDLASDPPVDLNPITAELNAALKLSARSVTASSVAELIKHLRRALQSRNTRSAIDSLLAMSNEKRMKSEAPAQAS